METIQLNANNTMRQPMMERADQLGISFEEYIWRLIEKDLSRKEVKCSSFKCIICGCTREKACAGGCYWISFNKCSRCISK